MGFRDHHRCGDHKILCEYRGSGGRNVAGNEREVQCTGLFKPAGSGGKAKTARKGGFGQGVIHDVVSCDFSFSSSCAMAANTDASAVPPGTLLEASAFSTVRPLRKSFSNKGEIF